MKKVFLILAFFGFLSLVLLFPQGVRQGVDTALSLCTNSLLPSLFPFMVMSNFVIKSGILPPSPFILGAVGGYPVGAQVVCDLKNDGRISKKDAELLLASSSLCSPGFMLGALGGIYGFKKALLLWLFHLLTSYAICLFTPKVKIKNAAALPFSTAFCESVKDSFFAFLAVCSFVIFFTVMCEVLGCLFTVPVFLRGVLEMSGGTFSRPAFPMAAFFTVFGGACVHFQILSLAASAGISAKNHFFTKLILGTLATLFAYLLTFFDI